MFTDGVDSHYQWVKARILAKNPTRVVAGLLNAQDWPSKPIKLDAFYLLVLGEVPVGREMYSTYSAAKFHQLQWVWINKGADIPAQGVRAANRGGRYRTMQAMKEELNYALVPGYTEKKSWSMVATGNPPPNDFKWTGVSMVPEEFITWNPIEFHERYDKDSGVGYGSGALRVFDMLDVVAS